MRLRRVLDAAVVVAVILITVPLCCGFVISIRADAERLTCQNNLKQICLSTIGCADTNHGRLPGVYSRFIWPGKPSDETFNKQVSWLYEIYPYFEARMDHKFFLDPTKPLDSEENRYIVDTSVQGYLCPSNPAH